MARISDNFSIKGNVHIQVWNEKGELTADYDAGHNTVTDVGDAWVANQLSGAAADLMSHMGVGTSASGGDDTALTDLVTPYGPRVVLTSTTQGVGAADNDIIYVASFTSIAATITEAGIFNDAAAGTMGFYNDSLSQLLTSGDTLQITWTVTFGAS